MAEPGRGVGPGRLVLFSFILFLLVVTVVFALAEVTLRLFYAQPYMMPRYAYSYLYGHELPANTTMVAARPGHWAYDYTINAYGYRGEPVEISDRFDRTNVVVLGDSYTMGAGVSDGEVYPVVLDEQLGPCFDVVNLGVGGYGLTHQIRRFYEFGILYRPEVVVLQFFSNDPADNLHDQITVIEDGRFRFVPTRQSTGWLKSLLADSVIQYSQVYNLARNSVYRFVRSRRLAEAPTGAEETSGAAGSTLDGATDLQQALYVELLTHFAADLRARGVDFYFIAVNGSLDDFRQIRVAIEELDRTGQLRHLEVEPWFEGVTDYGSPEGHGWGAKAHEIVGKQLALAIAPDGAGQPGARAACSTPAASADAMRPR